MFSQSEISFLRHLIGQGCIHMDPDKVWAIEDWEEFNNVHDVRVFLGMANYQKRFVEGFSKIISPLTNLSKKDK